MARNKKFFCVFCGEEILPEEGYDSSRIKQTAYYIFQCENLLCNALYESIGLKIPEIIVKFRPAALTELYFE